jgi:hypothetical protein
MDGRLICPAGFCFPIFTRRSAGPVFEYTAVQSAAVLHAACRFPVGPALRAVAFLFPSLLAREGKKANSLNYGTPACMISLSLRAAARKAPRWSSSTEVQMQIRRSPKLKKL